MGNKYLKLLKHVLNHGNKKQVLNSLQLIIASIACHNKGESLEKYLDVARAFEFNEQLVVQTIAMSFGDEEYNRMKKIWDNLPKDDNLSDE